MTFRVRRTVRRHHDFEKARSSLDRCLQRDVLGRIPHELLDDYNVEIRIINEASQDRTFETGQHVKSCRCASTTGLQALAQRQPSAGLLRDAPGLPVGLPFATPSWITTRGKCCVGGASAPQPLPRNDEAAHRDGSGSSNHCRAPDLAQPFCRRPLRSVWFGRRGARALLHDIGRQAPSAERATTVACQARGSTPLERSRAVRQLRHPK